MMADQDLDDLATKAVTKLSDEFLRLGWDAWDARQAMIQLLRMWGREPMTRDPMTQPKPWPHKRRMRRRPR